MRKLTIYVIALAISVMVASVRAADWRYIRTLGPTVAPWHYVVVPESYGADRAKYLAIIPEICRVYARPNSRCHIDFWTSENRIPKQWPFSESVLDFLMTDPPDFVATYQDGTLSLLCQLDPNPNQCFGRMPLKPQRSLTQSEWKIVWETSSHHVVVVSNSYGSQRDRYLAVVGKLCEPNKHCVVDFYFDESKVPGYESYESGNQTDEQRNAQVATYVFFEQPEARHLNGLILTCRFDSRPPCIVPYPRDDRWR